MDKFNLNKNKNHLKGFTLIELLIYMSLLSGFLVLLTQMFVSILDVKTESEATSAVEQDARYILTRFFYDIPRSVTITQPANLGDTSNNLVLNIQGNTYTYQLDADNLKLSNNLGINSLNSSESKISNLSFQKIGNPGGKETIQIKFDILSVGLSDGQPETRSFQTTVGKR